MAIAHVDTATASGSTASGAQSVSITIPAGANAAYIGIGYWLGGGGSSISGVTLDGQTATLLDEVNDGGGNNSVQLWYVTGFSSGASKTLAYTNASAYSDGVQFAVEFLSGVDVSGTPNGAHGNGSGASAITSTLTASAGDWAVMAWSADNTPTFNSGQNSQVVNTGTPHCGITTEALSGSDTQGITSGSFSTIAATIVHPSASATLDQQGFAFGDDDGNEASHTLGTEDTNYTGALGTKTLRLQIDATGDPASAAYSLRYQKNGSGGYSAVNVGSSSYVAPTLFGTAKSPTSDNAANVGPTATVTPPGSMTTGQFVVVIATYRATTGTITNSTDGGQTWSSGTQNNTGNLRSNVFWCTYNGTWSADPVFGVASGTNAVEAYMLVFDGVDTSGGPFDVAVSNGTDAGADTTIDISDWSTSTDNAVAVNVIVSQDNNSYSTFTGGWTQPEAQWRVTTTTGLSTTVSYKTQATAGAVGAFSAVQSAVGPDAAVTFHFALMPTLVTNEVYISSSANITNGESTTARLTAPTGKSGNFNSMGRYDTTNGGTTDLTSDYYGEIEFALTTQSPAATSDYFEFRVYKDGSALDTYTLTPKWTIGGGISATRDSFALTEHTATISSDRAISGALDTFALTQYAAGISSDRAINAGVNALTLGEYAATISSATDIAAAVDTFAMTEHAASLGSNVNINAAADSFALAEHAASVNAAHDLTGSLDAFTLSEHAASITLGTNIAAASQSLLLLTHSLDLAFNLTASRDSLSLTQFSATVSSDRALNATRDAFTLTEHKAATKADVALDATTDVLALSAYSATVETSNPLVILAGINRLSLSEYAAQIQPQPTTEQEATGGWNFYVAYEQEAKRRRRKQEELREKYEEVKQIPDTIDREIAILLQKEESAEERKAYLAHLGQLAKLSPDIEAAKRYGERVAKAYERVITQGNVAALEALDRQLQRALEEEEFVLMALRMIDEYYA